MKIQIKNFRGIKDFAFEFQSGAIISGANGAGKSTVYDAFLWCLTGTDRHGKDVNILPPPNENNKAAHVRIAFGDHIFCREYAEKWTRKRGSDSAEFTGYQTTLYLDDIEVDRTTFAQAVAEKFATPEYLPIVTNPEWFFDMDWKTRRQLIMKIVGILPDLDFDMEITKLEKARKLILKDQEEYPARIDELRRNYKEIEGVSDEVINEVKTTIDNLQKHMAQIPQHDQVAVDNLDNLIQKTNAEIIEAASMVNAKKRERAEVCEDIHYMENEMNILRIKFSEETTKTFTPSSNNCRACGQQLPSGLIEKEEDFNRKKSEMLEKIKAQGFKLKEAKEAKEKKVSEIDEELKGLAGNELTLRNYMKELIAHKMDIYNNPNPEHIKIQEQIKRAQSNLNELLVIQQQQHLNKDVFARIEELENQLTAVNSEAAKKEAEIFALKSKQKEYINKVTDAANNIWRGVTFEMFRHQINGGIADTCEVYINGVNVITANNAARIYYSLIIADSLNINKIPMFIDNAESCQHFPVTDAPQIRLIVADGQLNVTNI